ncbi:MAG: hypothetical protein AB6733_06655 [Clostridiaceae bacterium]
MKRVVLVGKIMRNPEGKAREVSIITDDTVYADRGKTKMVIIDKSAFTGNNINRQTVKAS